MTLEELKANKKAWDVMQERVDKELKEARKIIFTKHGFEDSCFRTDTPKDIQNIVWGELNEVEGAIRNKNPFYTDWVEEHAGADLFYNYLLSLYKED